MGLDKIKKRGKLLVITDYNSTSYFIYRGTPMGFSYDLLKEYADHLGVTLNIVLSTSIESTYSSLENEDVDMVAIDLPEAQEKSYLYFTDPVFSARPVLVQRKPGKIQAEEQDDGLIRDPKMLGGKKVYVQKGSPLTKMLTMLSFSTSDSIHIIEHPEFTAEQLIAAVAHGQIDYAISYENIAEANLRYYSNLDVKTVLGPGQNLVWIVQPSGGDLQKDFNQWLSSFRKSKKFAMYYDKYYVSPRTVKIVGSDLYSVRGGKISPYDQIIKKYSKIINWDWRLLASLIYHESKFHPEVQAWSGASGLMQLMPDVAEKYGINSISRPDKQIQAGVKYLESLDKQFRGMVKDQDERIKFVLAAYNVGLGHVLDARRLAAKYGKKNDLWTNNVDSFLLRKAEPKYYHDRLAFYGYCRGEEPFSFVKDVMEIYHLYRNAIRN